MNACSSTGVRRRNRTLLVGGIALLESIGELK